MEKINFTPYIPADPNITMLDLSARKGILVTSIADIFPLTHLSNQSDEVENQRKMIEELNGKNEKLTKFSNLQLKQIEELKSASKTSPTSEIELKRLISDNEMFKEEIKKKNEELQKKNKELERKNEEIEELIANLEQTQEEHFKEITKHSKFAMKIRLGATCYLLRDKLWSIFRAEDGNRATLYNSMSFSNEIEAGGIAQQWLDNLYASHQVPFDSKMYSEIQKHYYKQKRDDLSHKPPYNKVQEALRMIEDEATAALFNQIANYVYS